MPWLYPKDNVSRTLFWVADQRPASRATSDPRHSLLYGRRTEEGASDANKNTEWNDGTINSTTFS